MISDELLRQAAREAGAALLASLPEPQDCDFECSGRFEARMVRLLRRAKHPTAYRALSRAAGILLAILLTATVWLSVDANAREAVLGWVREVYESIFVYRSVDSEATFADPTTFRPTNLPDHWREVDCWAEESCLTVVYSGGDIGLFYFQALLPSDSALTLYEGRESISASVNGFPANYYPPTETGGNGSLIWEDPENHILFSLFAEESMEKLIEIAENLWT